MKSSPDRLTFDQPLRSVRILDARVASEALAKEREQAAYERGLRDGERALSAQLVQQRSELMQLQNGIFTSLRNAIPKVVSETEETLVALTIEIARKIVGEIPISVEMMASIVREALSDVQDTSECTVLIHPEDLALLEATNGPGALHTAGGERVRFEGDTTVERGGCLVKTRFGTVDAQRETKFALLESTLQTT